MTPTVWLSVTLCALFFLAIAGIPLWFVLRHKEWGPHHHDATGAAERAPRHDAVPVPGREPVPEGEPAPAQLAGTGARSFSDRG